MVSTILAPNGSPTEDREGLAIKGKWRLDRGDRSEGRLFLREISRRIECI